MPKTITIDTLVRGPLRISRNADDSLTVEAFYALRAGAEEVRSVGRDVSGLLTPAQRTALSDGYNAVFAAVEAAELA